MQENRRGFQGFSNPLGGVRLVTHINAGSTQTLRHLRMASLAEGRHQLRIVIASGNVVLFKAYLSSALEAAQLFRSSGQTPRGLNGQFIHHDDAAGRA
jgi:hypothetical protein